MRGPSPPVSLLAWSSLLVAVLAFLALLGGTHPSDRGRDATLVVVAGVIAGMNLPSALWALRERRAGRPHAASLVGTALRLALAGAILWFVHGISHEGHGSLEPPLVAA